MNKCGKTLLKWKEPKTIIKLREKKLTFAKLLFQKHSLPFLSGFILFFILIILEAESVPTSFSELMFLLIVSSIMGLVFVIIYGLLDLTSPRIYLKDNCIIRIHVEDVKQIKYSEIKGYDISDFVYENQHIGLFILEHIKNQRDYFEIDSAISGEKIDKVLENKIQRHEIKLEKSDLLG